MSGKPGGTSVDPPADADVGTATASFLTGTTAWTSRHVEHFELLDKMSALRRLTVDLRLAGATTTKLGDAEVYYAPVALIAKQVPLERMDLRDEDGKALPLLTRQENAALSEAAICTVASKMAGTPLDDELKRLLQTIAREDAEVARIAAKTRLDHDGGREVADKLSADPLWPRFARFVVRLVGNSMLWVPLAKGDGPMRIVKLSYETHLGSPFRFGLATLFLEEPHYPGGDKGSYHLQFTAPPGLTTRSVRLEVGQAFWRSKQRRPPHLARTGRGAHLYLEDIRLRGQARVAFALRLSRAGFLSSALVASVLIALLLAAFTLWSDPLSKRPEVSVAILLVVPALLVAFAVREEHAIAKSLLRGPRYLLACLGLLAVGAALALAGFGSEGQDLHEWWTALAGLAGLCALGMLGTWLRAGRAIREPKVTNEVEEILLRRKGRSTDCKPPSGDQDNADEVRDLSVGSAQAPVEAYDRLFGIEIPKRGEEIELPRPPERQFARAVVLRICFPSRVVVLRIGVHSRD